MRFASWLALEPVPFVPEVLLHQAEDMHGLWGAVGGASPPYWAFPWLGGQGLARYLLDSGAVAGRTVLDLATGSGLVALAALRSGAASVLAVDIDPLAGEAVAANAEANGIDVPFLLADLLAGPPPEVDVIVAGDVFYEQAFAARVVTWLGSFNGQVLVGDPLRDYRPRQGFGPVASYEIPTTRELEGVAMKRTDVLTLLS